MRRKTVINARVVVVGPSETSLATLETLILQARAVAVFLSMYALHH